MLTPRFWLLLSLLLPAVLPAVGQTTHQSGYWLRGYVRVQLSERWVWHSELDERRLLAPDRQWQLITHHHVHYRLLAPLEVAVGGTYSRQPPAVGNGGLPEWRVFTETTLTNGLSSRVRLQSRLRAEQRWLNQAVEQGGTWSTRQRYRYRVQLDWQKSSAWKLRASNEVMFHPDSFDQNRLYAGVERKLGAGFATELGYLWVYQRRYHRPEYFDRQVLRLTLFKDFAFHNSKSATKL